MSIKLRLLLLTATGLLAALFMGLDSLFNNARTAAAVNDNQVSLTALRNHLEADMMHDALRADVLSALLVGLNKVEFGDLQKFALLPSICVSLIWLVTSVAMGTITL